MSQDCLHGVTVGLSGGADELVRSDLKEVPSISKLRDGTIAKLFGRDTFGSRFVGDVLTVLIGAGDQPAVHAASAVVSSQHVCQDSGVTCSHMGRRVDIVYRGGDVVLRIHRFRRSSGEKKAPGLITG